jgi:ribonuclease VapC
VIVLETSALVAVLRQEPERPRILSALNEAEAVSLSAVSRYEALVVLRAKGSPNPAVRVDQLVAEYGIEVVAFDAAQSAIAFQAYARFGKGSGSRARLNLADCASYALATSLAAPLLLVGNDFAHTCIDVA